MIVYMQSTSIALFLCSWDTFVYDGVKSPNDILSNSSRIHKTTVTTTNSLIMLAFFSKAVFKSGAVVKFSVCVCAYILPQ